MRFAASLEEIFADTGHLRVLRALYESYPSKLTGREVAQLAMLSVAQTARVLSKLQDQGIGTSEAAGRASLWSWNPEHAWSESLRSIFQREAAMRDELRKDLSEAIRGLPVKRAALFGSIARGDERVESDVDVFFETPSIEASGAVLDRISTIQLAIVRKYREFGLTPHSDHGRDQKAPAWWNSEVDR